MISKSFYFFLSCLICFLISISTQSIAQDNPNQISQSKVKRSEKKKKSRDSEMENFVSVSKANQKGNYQGTGRTLTTKVKNTNNKRKIRDLEAERASFSGNIKYIDIAKERGKKDQKLAAYSGTVKYVDIAKEREKKDRKLANYSGKISIAKLNNRKRRIRDKAHEISAYSGNIRFVNVAKKRAQKDRKLDKYKGPNPIRIKRKPKGSITSYYKGQTSKNRAPANYNKKTFKKGRVVKKSELPNYQKNKPGKLRYDSRETKMWTEGSSNLPKRGERKLPKNNKAKNKKEAKENKNKTKELSGE